MKIKIFLSGELNEVLKKLVTTNNCKAAKLLQTMATVGVDKSHLISDFANYISFSKEDKKKLAFSRTSDIVKYSELSEELVVSPGFTVETSKYDFWKKRRNSISPGRIFSRILTPEYFKSILSDSDIENFSNRYTAEMDNQLEFEIVSGEDIRKHYLKDTYSSKHGTSGNSLWQSCMNNENTQKFLDIYTLNPNNVQLLVVKHPGGVVGRALIWRDAELYTPTKSIKDQTPIVTTFMDRCYFTQDWIMNKMLDFARSNGWYARYYQKPQEHQVLQDPKGQANNFLVKVKMDNLRCEFYPYMDTMFYIDYKTSTLSNSNLLTPEGESSDRQLRQTGGFPNTVWDYINNAWIRRGDSVWIKNKTTYFNKTNAIFSDKAKDYFLKAECLYSKLDNEYITPDEDIAVCCVTNESYKKARMVFSNYLNGMIHKKESVDASVAGIIHKKNAVWSKTLGVHFVDKDVIKIESLDDYLPKSILEQVDEKQFINFLGIMKTYKPDKEEVTQTQESYLFEF